MKTTDIILVSAREDIRLYDLIPPEFLVPYAVDPDRVVFQEGRVYPACQPYSNMPGMLLVFTDETLGDRWTLNSDRVKFL